MAKNAKARNADDRCKENRSAMTVSLKLPFERMAWAKDILPISFASKDKAGSVRRVWRKPVKKTGSAMKDEAPTSILSKPRDC